MCCVEAETSTFFLKLFSVCLVGEKIHAFPIMIWNTVSEWPSDLNVSATYKELKCVCVCVFDGSWHFRYSRISVL